MSHKGQFVTHINQRYQELCAKVAYGGASEGEFNELIEHLPHCAQCQTLLRDFIKIVAGALPKIARTYRSIGDPSALTAEPTAKELRAIATNAQSASDTEPSRRVGWPSLAALAASALLCLTSLMLNWGIQRHHQIQNASPAHPVVLTDPGTSSQAGKNAGLTSDLITATEKLRTAQKRIRELEANAKADEQALSSSRIEKMELLSRATTDAKTVVDLRGAVEDRGVKIGQLQEQLAQKNAAMLAKDAELKFAAAETAQVREQLSQEHEHNAGFRQLQTLLASRNLHFADIHDHDPTGTGPFGRVLYAKGQSLMFYAYALDSRRQSNTAVSYHVWGKETGTEHTYKSLGFLRNEDHRDGHWRLTFDDPDVLGQIDAVFVTAESDKRARTQPSGKQILATNLNGNANHP